MPSRYPLTIEQLREINRDLADMKVRAEEMLNLMGAACGEADQRAVRAQELAAAIQRLQWAIERSEKGQGISVAGSHA